MSKVDSNRKEKRRRKSDRKKGAGGVWKSTAHTDTDGHSNTLSTDTQEKLRHPLLFVAVVLLCPGLFTTADVCKRGQSYVKEFTFLLPAKTGDWGRTPSRIMRGIAALQMAVRMMVHNPLQWVRRDTLEGNFNKGEKTKTWLDEKDQQKRGNDFLLEMSWLLAPVCLEGLGMVWLQYEEVQIQPCLQKTVYRGEKDIPGYPANMIWSIALFMSFRYSETHSEFWGK